jgi:hypothetical protein
VILICVTFSGKFPWHETRPACNMVKCIRKHHGIKFGMKDGVDEVSDSVDQRKGVKIGLQCVPLFM